MFLILKEIATPLTTNTYHLFQNSTRTPQSTTLYNLPASYYYWPTLLSTGSHLIHPSVRVEICCYALKTCLYKQYLRWDNFVCLLLLSFKSRVNHLITLWLEVAQQFWSTNFHIRCFFQTSFCSLQLSSNNLQSIQNLSNLFYKNQTFRFYMFYDVLWKKTEIFQPVTTAPGSRIVTCTPIKAHRSTKRGLIKTVFNIMSWSRTHLDLWVYLYRSLWFLNKQPKVGLKGTFLKPIKLLKLKHILWATGQNKTIRFKMAVFNFG